MKKESSAESGTKDLQERVSLLMRIPACHIIHVHPDGA
jgi:hypothetical protein